MMRALLGLLLLAALPAQAQKISDLDALGAGPATGDFIVIVDVSDTTMAATGTTKKITAANLFQFSGPYAGSVTAADVGGDTTTFPMLATDATGTTIVGTDAGITYNATTNALTATTFVGALTGNSSTATALAANGANCSAGEAPRGVDASGAAENCTAYLASGGTITAAASGSATNPTFTFSGDTNTGIGNGAGGDALYSIASGTAISYQNTGGLVFNVANTFDVTNIRNIVNMNGNATIAAPLGGATHVIGQVTEAITLSTSGTTTDSVANLLPAGAILQGITCRVTTTITTATNWSVGDGTTAARFCSANSTLTAGTTSVCLNHQKGGVTTDAAGPTQDAAAKLRITTSGTPGAGVIRCTVFYDQFTAPTAMLDEGLAPVWSLPAANDDAFDFSAAA